MRPAVDHATASQAAFGRLELKSITEPGVVGFVLWDTSGRIEDANDRFLEMIGYGRQDIGRLDWQLLTPDDVDAGDSTTVESLERHGISRSERKEYVRGDGGRIFARLHSTLLSDAPGKVVSIVVDVSEERRAEQEQRRLMEAEMHARTEAENAVRARDDILGIVSHDLRNP